MKRKVLNIALAKTKKYIIILILSSIFFSYITLKIAENLEYAIDGILFNNYDIIPEYTRNILNHNYVHDLLVFAIIIILLNFVNMIVNYIRDRVTTKFQLKININILKNMISSIILN